MVELFRTTSARVWFAALYALATILVGFAHRNAVEASSRAERMAVYAAAYQLPGGLLPDICFDGDDGHADDHAGARSCDACRLADAPGLDLPETTLVEPPRVLRIAAYPPAETLRIGSLLHRPQARGPPSAAVA